MTSKSLIFAADALAYGSYCVRLMLLGITAWEKYLMPVTYKWWLADFQKPFLKTNASEASMLKTASRINVGKFMENIKHFPPVYCTDLTIVALHHIITFVCCKVGQNGYCYRYCSGYCLDLGCLHCTGSVCMLPLIHIDLKLSLI